MARIVRLEDIQQFAAINLLSDPGHIAGPVYVPNCAQIHLVWTLADAKTGRNVLYGRYAGAFAGTVAQADAIKAALTTGANWTALAAHIAPTAQLTRVSIRNVGVQGTPQPFIDSTSAAAPGTSTGTALPDEVAACVTLRTASVGPSGRGRFFVPGWATTALGAGGVMAAPAVTALQNWASQLIGPALSSQGYTWVIGLPARNGYTSPTTGRIFPPRAATSAPIIAGGVLVRDNRWDSQRRRGLR